MATFLYVLIICSLVQKISFQAYKVDYGEIFRQAEIFRKAEFSMEKGKTRLWRNFQKSRNFQKGRDFQKGRIPLWGGIIRAFFSAISDTRSKRMNRILATREEG